MPPILPPVNLPPYDPVEVILTFARAIANDMGQSAAGNLLADTQPYIFPLLNLAWRKLQDRLENNAIEDFPQELIIVGIPPQNAVSFADPAVQCYLGFSGYYDGGGMNPTFFLPQDLQIPIRVWERPTGQNARFIQMYPSRDGLPSNIKTSYNIMWEWRDEAIYFPGANQTLDFRIRYKRFLADMIGETNQPIPLLRCAVALAYLLIEVFATSRGSTVTPLFSAEKEDAIKQLINTTTRKKQRTNYRRIPYSRRRVNW